MPEPEPPPEPEPEPLPQPFEMRPAPPFDPNSTEPMPQPEMYVEGTGWVYYQEAVLKLELVGTPLNRSEVFAMVELAYEVVPGGAAVPFDESSIFAQISSTALTVSGPDVNFESYDCAELHCSAKRYQVRSAAASVVGLYPGAVTTPGRVGRGRDVRPPLRIRARPPAPPRGAELCRAVPGGAQ